MRDGPFASAAESGRDNGVLETGFLRMNVLWSAASLLTGNLVRTRGPKTGSSIYLTFDDGPHPEHTPRLLEVLGRHRAKGSFFVVGREAENHPGIVEDILREGHSIGNHSMLHPKMRTLGAAAQWAEIDRADRLLMQFDGRARHGFRPPNGRVTWPVMAASVMRRQALVLWTIDSLDYKLGASNVVNRLGLHPPQDGDVILFHDDARCVSDALDILLPLWKSRGLSFPALD